MYVQFTSCVLREFNLIRIKVNKMASRTQILDMFFICFLKKIKCKSKSRKGSFQKTYIVHCYLEIIETDKKRYSALLSGPSKHVPGQVFRKIQVRWNKMSNFKFNQLSTNVPLLYPLKTSENLRFSDVFKGVQKWNIG